MMTGLGKSLCIAALMNYYVNKGKRVLQLVPRLELVEQNYKEAFDYIDKKNALGIVCGQLGKKEIYKQAVIAMASSFVGSRAISGKFDIILCDECHLIHWKPPGEKPGTYQKIITSQLRLNPDVLVVGLTATGYRLDQGELHEKSHKALPFFTHKVYDSSIDPGLKRLIEEGYLSHIHTLNTPVHVDLTGVKMSGLDYNATDAGVKFDAIIENAVQDMREQFKNNNVRTALIFASNIANALHILKSWGNEFTMRIICGNDKICSNAQRRDAIEWFKNGSGCRYIVNVDILTTGFDHAALDCVVLLRATTSPGLLVQMIGRVIRPHDDKEQGYLIDYGTNIERLTDGGIENIKVPLPKKSRGDAPKKICGNCNEFNILSAKRCKKCDAEFINEDDSGKYTMRTRAEALALKKEKKTETRNISSVIFSNHNKNGIDIVKIDFYEQSYDEQEHHICSDYLCFNHSGSAQGLAIAKLRKLLKNPAKDYRQIAQFEGGICTKSVLFLLNEYYDQFLKQ
jgi:DNA repair protein RadD